MYNERTIALTLDGIWYMLRTNDGKNIRLMTALDKMPSTDRITDIAPYKRTYL